jgi:hypothetical protein
MYLKSRFVNQRSNTMMLFGVSPGLHNEPVLPREVAGCFGLVLVAGKYDERGMSI